MTLRLITDNFVKEYDPTIEDNYRKPIRIDGQVERLDILDTAGQEEYNSMRDMWYDVGQGFLLVYSLTVRSTFEELVGMRKEILMVKDSVDCVPIVLVGNKCDLEDERVVAKEEGLALAASWGCPFFEASAKDKVNDKEVFFTLVREIRRMNIPAKTESRSHTSKKFCILL